MITIYTDGAAKGNPGPGGYGIVMKFNGKRKELSAGFRLTTNNRMELMAVIVALKQLKTDKYPVTIYTDSKYVVNAVKEGWIWSWEKKNFKKKKNVDLWKQFIPLYKKFDITFKWIKGHAGNQENERCDQLAVAGAEGSKLKEDKGYDPNDPNPALPL